MSWSCCELVCKHLAGSVQAGLHDVGHQDLPEEGQRDFMEEGHQDLLEKGHWDLSEESQIRQLSTAHVGEERDTFGSPAAMWTPEQGAGYPQGQSLAWRKGCTLCEFGHMAEIHVQEKLPQQTPGSCEAACSG